MAITILKGDNMRKVLLATTALVAMNVTAASADVSISGTGVFEILSPDTGAQTYTTDGSMVVTGTTTSDAGITFKAVQDYKFERNDSANGKNDSYLEMSGDFGTVRMGYTDGALDRMDGNLAANMILKEQVPALTQWQQQPSVVTQPTFLSTLHQSTAYLCMVKCKPMVLDQVWVLTTQSAWESCIRQHLKLLSVVVLQVQQTQVQLV